MTSPDAMATTEGTRAAYGVKCPKCKAKPGMFCTVLGPIPGPYSPPNPRLGKPAKRPHNERFDKVWENQRKAAWAAYAQERRGMLADPVADERRALADLARQEHAQMRAWLRDHGRILWT